MRPRSQTPAPAPLPTAIRQLPRSSTSQPYQVSKAFEKGAVLYDGDGGRRNYMVHASHRDKPGMAEIHTKDTDVIYVLEGTTTFVTGGTAVDPKNIAPDEIRGASIRGGDSRTLRKGDVIIVPNGVPHWFEEIPGPFNYYVVKVR